MKNNPVNIEADDDFVDEIPGKLNCFRFRLIYWTISSRMFKVQVRLGFYMFGCAIRGRNT